MSSRTPDLLPEANRTRQQYPTAIQQLRSLAQKQITVRIGQVKTWVQEHPATGISAAFCMGVLLGWIVKRR